MDWRSGMGRKAVAGATATRATRKTRRTKGLVGTEATVAHRVESIRMDGWLRPGNRCWLVTKRKTGVRTSMRWAALCAMTRTWISLVSSFDPGCGMQDAFEVYMVGMVQSSERWGLVQQGI